MAKKVIGKQRHYAPLSSRDPDKGEPLDAYTAIPEPALRKYFRARASLYAMTTQSYRGLRIEVSSFVYKMLARGARMKVRLGIDIVSAKMLGELWRDRGKHPYVSVYNIDFGGRMRVRVADAIECHSMMNPRQELTLVCYAFVESGRPLRREWISRGPSVTMAI